MVTSVAETATRGKENQGISCRMPSPLTQTFLLTRVVHHIYHISLEQQTTTDAGTSTPFGGLWTFWVRKKCSPRQLAFALPAAIRTTAETRGGVRGTFHLLPCSRVSFQHVLVNDEVPQIILVDTWTAKEYQRYKPKVCGSLAPAGSLPFVRKRAPWGLHHDRGPAFLPSRTSTPEADPSRTDCRTFRVDK